MKATKWIREFLMAGAITFVVTAVVSFLYSLIAHGTGVVDWGYAVRFGVIFGIIIPWMNRRR
jgi:hypothetical protein